MFDWNQRWHGSGQGFWVWVEDSDNIRIYHQEYVLFSKRTHPDSINLELVIPAFDPLPPQYFVRVVSDSWVGSESLLPVSFQHLLMPSNHMPYTDLIDLTPLPTTALGNSKYEQLYSKFEVFNPIQTQLFHALYHQDTPILLGAPTGSGKTIVAEITLLRMKKRYPGGKCVYIAPLKSLARERLKEWKKKLGGEPLKWKVLELSGDTHHDKRTLEKADVLVCTPEKWDLVSRGWRNQSQDSITSKNFVKDVRLLIIDEIHLLGEERGAVLEAIVSRTRFISRVMLSHSDPNDVSSNTAHEPTRIVGLSTAIANPYDLASWMGIDVDSIKLNAKIGLYNFRPSVRPIPMKVHIQGFSGRHYCPRMATMNKPCYAAIREHSPTKPVIIFVASRRQTRLTALDLINYAAGDQNPSVFLGCSDEYAHSIASSLHDASLRHTISYGIGLHHAGLSSHDREKVENMFLNGDIQVLVATATLAWGVNLPAHLVIVKGTEFFDGRESRYVDYPVTDVLQMMGRAGRPQFDTEGIACIFVEESKKNFYKKFLYDPFPVESCLDSRMADNLNAEIATGTVLTIEDCVGWLDWTFYARRVRMNPSYYGAESGDDDIVNEFLLQKVVKCIDELKESGCVITDVDDNMGQVIPTYLGITSCKFYLHHKTPHQMRIGCKSSRQLILRSLDQFHFDTEGEPGFSFPAEIEELAVASILFHLSHTYEFSEIPVRHNEEHLNARLADELPWGAMIPVATTQRGLKKNNNVDVETYLDPSTKCYLLIQAFITDTELPISDYVNDTSTVLDQLPRLLAAMENVANHEMTAQGTFDMYCMFPIVRQILNSRMLPGEDPLIQLCSIPYDKTKQLIKQGISLRKLCLMTDYSSLRLSRKSQLEIQLLPFFKFNNIHLALNTDKVSGRCEGVISFTLELHQKVAENRKQSVEFSFDAILGTQNQSILLGQKKVMLKVLSRSSGDLARSIEIKFDWGTAKSSSQDDGGSVVLRVFNRDVRGLDLQRIIPLSDALHR
jgi:activating signal cointegrator complex subunit 3